MGFPTEQFVRSFPEFRDTANLLRAAATGLQLFVVASLAYRISLAYVMRPYFGTSADNLPGRAKAFFAGRLAFALSYGLSIPIIIAWVAAFPTQFASYHGPNIDRPYLVLGFLGWGEASILTGLYFYHARVGRRLGPIEMAHALRFDFYLDPFLILSLPLLAAVSDRVDGPTITALVVISVLYVANFVAGHAVLRLMGTVRPLEEPWARIVVRVAAEADLPKLTVWSVRCSDANAYSMPGCRVYFAESLLAELNEAEFEAVLWHEVGHQRESFREKVVRHAALPLLLVLNAGPAFVGQYGMEKFLIVPMAFFLVLRLVARHARAMEVKADGYARAHAPDSYAAALRTIHRLALIPDTTGMKNATHPDLAERIGVSPAESAVEQSTPAMAHQSRAYLGVLLYVACFLGGLAVSEYWINAAWR